MEKYDWYLQTFSNQERIDPISTRHSLYIRTVGPYSILPIRAQPDIAPTYLLLPLGKRGLKWGDFHWAMGCV